jgi:hypothetical protein
VFDLKNQADPVGAAAELAAEVEVAVAADGDV